MKSTIPTNRSLPDNRELSQARKKSITQEMGSSLFEQALASEKRDSLASEAGYGILPPGINAKAADESRTPISSSSPKPEELDARISGADSERSEPLAMDEELNAEEVSDDPAKPAESSSDTTADETRSANENSIEGVEIDGSEVDAQEFYEMSEIESDAENSEESDAIASVNQAKAGADDGNGEETSDAGQELFEDVSVETEVFGLEKNMAVKDTSQAAPISSVEVAAPNSDLAHTGTTGLGREAFARATTVQRAANATLTRSATNANQIDMQEVVDQIDKARGSMSGSRARVVLGEGSDRITMMVSVKNGVVDIDLKASDTAIADALADGSDELSAALSKHGLSLGDMGSDSETRGDREFEANGEGSAPTTEYEDNLARTPSALRQGIRVVA